MSVLKKTDELTPHLIALRKAQPTIYDAFQSVGKATYVEGELSHLTKELIATAIAISVNCEPCIGYHVRSLVKLGVTREAFTEMLGVVIQMGGGPGLMKAGEAMSVYEELTN